MRRRDRAAVAAGFYLGVVSTPPTTAATTSTGATPFTWGLYEWPEYYEGETQPGFRKKYGALMAVLTVVVELTLAPAVGLPRGAFAVVVAVHLAMMGQDSLFGTYRRHPRLQSALAGLSNTALCVALPTLATRWAEPLWAFFVFYAVVAARAFAPSVGYAVAVVVFPAVGGAVAHAVYDRAFVVKDAFVIGGVVGFIYVAMTLIQSAQRARDRQHADDALRLSEVEATLLERSRVAADLHDTLGATLTEIGLWLDVARQKGVDDESLVRARERAAAALAELRSAVNGFDDVDVDADRAAAVVAARVGGLCDAAGVALDIDVDGDGVVAAVRARDLLKIAEEAVVNAVRHGRASRVEVALRWGDRPRLRVVDDGCGFDPGAVVAGAGLRNMRGRAAALDARLVVEGNVGGGTVVAVCDLDGPTS